MPLALILGSSKERMLRKPFINATNLYGGIKHVNREMDPEILTKAMKAMITGCTTQKPEEAGI